MQTWLIVCSRGNNMSKEVSDRPHILISGNGLGLPINITCVRRTALCHLGALWCNEDDIIFFLRCMCTQCLFHLLCSANEHSAKTNPKKTGYFYFYRNYEHWFLFIFSIPLHTDNEAVLSSPWTGMEDAWAEAVAKHRATVLIKEREITQTQVDHWALWLFF